jgi:hypothetical protein
MTHKIYIIPIIIFSTGIWTLTMISKSKIQAMGMIFFRSSEMRTR